MSKDYESPVQHGKNIVVGQAAILWGEAFTHPDRGQIAGGWILPGCARTTNGEHALRVCRELNESIKQANRKITQATSHEHIGALIRQQFVKLEG